MTRFTRTTAKNPTWSLLVGYPQSHPPAVVVLSPRPSSHRHRCGQQARTWDMNPVPTNAHCGSSQPPPGLQPRGSWLRVWKQMAGRDRGRSRVVAGRGGRGLEAVGGIRPGRLVTVTAG